MVRHKCRSVINFPILFSQHWATTLPKASHEAVCDQGRSARTRYSPGDPAGYLTGTRCFNSSNQLSTTLMRLESPGAPPLIISRRRPSGVTS
jgi:hypothetical protein